MSTYRTEYRDRDRDRDRDRERRYDRDPYNYHDRRDGERDRRDRDYDRDYDRGDRDYDRGTRDRERSRSRSRSRDGGSRDRDIDRLRTDRREASSKTSMGTAPRPPQRTLSSPSHKSGASTNSSPPPPPPRKPPTALTTPTSSAPSTPRFSDGSTHLGKIAEALRTVSKRSYEHVSIQLRKDVVEARAKEREQNRKMLQQKYTEFPSLREAHRKSQKKDEDDLAALRKDEHEADKRTLATTEQLASTLFQILSELQLDKDRQATSKNALNAVDSLEARISARLGALEAKHREDAERQEKRIEELSKGILAETTQRKLLSEENESLKTRLRDVERKGEAYRSLVDQHTASIKLLQTAKVDAKTTQAIPDPSVQAQHAAELQTIRDDLVYLHGKVAEHDTKLGELDIDLISESCDAIVSKLPRFEQNVRKATEDVRKATEDVLGLRTDSEQLRSQLRVVESQSKNLETLVELRRTEQDILRSKTEKFQTSQQFSASSEKLEAGVEQLRSDFRQLNSEMEKVRTNRQSFTNTKQLEASIGQLRSDFRQLNSKMEKTQTSRQSSAEIERLKAGVEQLQSDFRQLNSGMEKIQASLQSSADKEQVSAEVKQLQSYVKGLKSEIQALRTRTQPPVGERFATAKEAHALYARFANTVGTSFGKMVEDLRTRTTTLENNAAEAQPNPNPDDGQTPNQTSAVIESAIQLNEQKLHEHDERIRALESSSQAQEQSAKVSREEARGALEKNQAAFEEVTLNMIETMKTQVAMSEQSLKSLSESVKLMTDNQSAHTGRLGEVESEVLKLGTRLEGSEQSLRSAEQKFEKRMDLVQHNYTSLDSQMNNLTTEGLFQAIIRHLDKYQPSNAQLGQKVDTIIQQVNQHEHRLVKVERSSSASEEPAHKKRKYSPNGYAMTNGVR